MLRIHNRLEPGTCAKGKQWYVCQANNFSGCCSVDACDLSTCPDTGSGASETLAGSTKTTTLAMTTVGSSAALSSTPSTTISPPTSRFLGNGAIATNGPVASIPASPTASVTMLTPTSTPVPVKSSSKAPLIAGAVSGVVAVSMLLALLLFCIRRRQAKDRRENIANFGTPSKDYVLDRAKTPEPRNLAMSSVFEPFGGRYSSPPPNPAHLSRPSSSRPPQTPVEDRHIPDIEKDVKIAAPPLSSHPAYHALSTSSPPPELYQHHPGTPIPVPHMPSPCQSPIDYQPPSMDYRVTPPRRTYSPPIPSPPMMQHPAYHASQLSKHPAFRSSPPRNRNSPSPPRKLPGTGSSMPVLEGPSPMPGHIELAAGDVPAEYLSPTPPQIIFANAGPSHSKSKGSTYSIPIGLGLSREDSHQQFGADLQAKAHPTSYPYPSGGLVHPHLRAQEHWPSSSSSQTREVPPQKLYRKAILPNTNCGTLACGNDKEVLSHHSGDTTPRSPERWSGSGITRETATANTSCESSPDTASPPWNSDPRNMVIRVDTGSDRGSGAWGGNAGGFGQGGFVVMGGDGKGKGKEREPEEMMLEAKTPMTAVSEGYGTEAGVSTWGSWIDR